MYVYLSIYLSIYLYIYISIYIYTYMPFAPDTCGAIRTQQGDVLDVR